MFSAAAFVALLWISALVWIGSLAVCVWCLLKAYKGERRKLPLAGDYAERKMATLNFSGGMLPPEE
jgi:uncharacterized membrane protein